MGGGGGRLGEGGGGGGGGEKSIVNSKESGRGRGVKITPMNGVLD